MLKASSPHPDLKITFRRSWASAGRIQEAEGATAEVQTLNLCFSRRDKVTLSRSPGTTQHRQTPDRAIREPQISVRCLIPSPKPLAQPRKVPPSPSRLQIPNCSRWQPPASCPTHRSRRDRRRAKRDKAPRRGTGPRPSSRDGPAAPGPPVPVSHPRPRPTLTTAQPLHPVVDDGAVVPLVLQAPGGEALDGLHRVGDRLQLPIERGL